KADGTGISGHKHRRRNQACCTSQTDSKRQPVNAADSICNSQPDFIDRMRERCESVACARSYKKKRSSSPNRSWCWKISHDPPAVDRKCGSCSCRCSAWFADRLLEYTRVNRSQPGKYSAVVRSNIRSSCLSIHDVYFDSYRNHIWISTGAPIIKN